MTDAEACTRDAALMVRLGINNIYIGDFDPTGNHDDCFSIFNSVGIYVTVMLIDIGYLYNRDIDNFYTTERLKEFFQRIDAIKDYENLLGIDVGVLPAYNHVEDGRIADLQKMFRVSLKFLGNVSFSRFPQAFIRDVKEYIHHNSPRPLLVGASISREITSEDGNITMTPFFLHMSCVVPDEDVSSSAEFVGFYESSFFELQSSPSRLESLRRLVDQLVITAVPTWFSGYGTPEQSSDGESTLQVTNETLQETAMLYNSTNDLVVTSGPLSGGNRFEWYVEFSHAA